MSLTPPKVPAPHVLAELALIGLAVLLVAALGARADAWPVESYYYLAKARSLAQGHLLHVNWGDGVDRRFFWGYSIALAPLIRVFGDASFWLLGAFLHGFAGFALSRILRMLPLERPARLGALALALFNPLVLRFATVPLPEPLLLALGASAIFFALRYRAGASRRELLWAAALSGTALFTRVEGLFVAAAVGALCAGRLVREDRRFLGVGALGLVLGAELLHLAYLALHASPATSPFASLDLGLGSTQAFGPRLWSGFVGVLRAPFWLSFLFDGEPWLYARYFPPLLTALQGLVLALYAFSVIGALATGFFRRGHPFAIAATLCAYAFLRALVLPARERFGYLAAPLAAVALAWGFQSAFAWAREKFRSRAVLVACLAAATVSGAYGMRASQMNAARLRASQGGRDLRQVARATSQALEPGRTAITDLGPAVAYYLPTHVFFDRSEPELYEDQVPSGEAGRVFLMRHRVGAIATSRSVREVQAEFDLAPDELEELGGAPGATLVRIEPDALSAVEP